MKSFKETICSRRGVAIELAMMVMLLAVAFGIVFLTVNVLQTEQVRDTSAELKEQIAIDEAGEWAVRDLEDKLSELSVADEEGFNDLLLQTYGGDCDPYSYSYSSKTITVKKSGNVVLTIEVEISLVKVDETNDIKIKILSWNR